MTGSYRSVQIGQVQATSVLPRSRYWWLALTIILILAAWLYYRGYDASLPYIDHSDEPAFNLAAQTIIDTGSARPIAFDAYPPGIITLNYLLIKHLKPAKSHFSSVLPALRLITISAWMSVLILIALIGAQLAQPATGLIAAAIWTVNPWVVEYVRFALADGYVTFFALLSLFLALVGMQHGRRSLVSAATYSLMLATVFKTQAVFLAPLILMIPLINVWRLPSQKPEVSKAFIWNCFRFLMFTAWLLLLYPTLEADRIPFWVAPSRSLSLPGPLTIWENVAPVLRQFQSLESWLPTMLFAFGLLLDRRRSNRYGIATILIAALSWLFGMSLFGKQELRHFFFLGAVTTLLYAQGLTGLALVLVEIQKRTVFSNLSSRAQHITGSAIVAIVLAIGIYSRLQVSTRIAHQFTLHDRRNDLATYVDTSLEPGSYVTNYDNHKTLNRHWGGYNGINDFSRYPENALLTDKPIEEWRELGVEYAIMPHYPLLEDPDIYYTDETVLLKAYPVDSNFRGPSMVVLRLYPMQHETNTRLGSIRLIGYDINATQLDAGDDLILRHYWQAENATTAPNHVFNHLLDSTGAILTQADGFPLWDRRRDTTTWDDPEEILLGRNFVLRVPPDLIAGKYFLVSGLYEPISGQRLRDGNGKDHISVSEILVNNSQ